MKARRALKCAIFGAAVLLVSPAILLARLEAAAGKSEVIFTLFAQLLALLPGKPGNYLRSGYYFGTLTRSSWEIDIGFGSHFTHRDCRLDANVSTGSYCVIGHVSIERNVRLASRVSIPSGKRQHLDQAGNLSSGTVYEQVSIGRDSWIGEGALIMADVGEGCIVSAGAVVVYAVPPMSVVGGNPAKVLKSLAARSNPPGVD
jgi:acetyltransferase-like isoleucine patch superfamily enzyme